MQSEVLEILDLIALAKPTVLVWGDRCIDTYQTCVRRGDRLVLVREDEFAGMAGGVQDACASIGAIVKGVTYGTVRHERTIVDGAVVQWVERCGHGEWNSRWDVEKEIMSFNPRAILISDYGRGMCGPDKLQTVIRTGVPCIVDPHRQRDLTRYAGASVIKCSREHYVSNLVMGDTAFVYTNGEHGIWLDGAKDRAASQHFPTEPIDQPFDCGAGDVVLAALGCAVAAGIDLARACRLANAVAGVKCRRLGPLSMSPGELRAALAG